MELAVTIDDGDPFVFASHDPTRTAAAEPTGRAAFRTFLAGIRLQRSELNWRPDHARPAASPARAGSQPRLNLPAPPSRPPYRRICAQTTGQSIQSAQANARQI